MITVGWIKIRDNTYVTSYVLAFNLNAWAPYTAGMYGGIPPWEIGKSHKDIQCALFYRVAETGKELGAAFLSSFLVPLLVPFLTATFFVFINISIKNFIKLNHLYATYKQELQIYSWLIKQQYLNFQLLVVVDGA